MPVTVREDFSALDRVQPWKKLVHVVAAIRRFAHNCRAKIRPDLFTRKTDDFSAEELIEAKQILLIYAQQDLGEINQYKNLSHFTDAVGIVRVGGRLEKAEISYDQIHPILLPSNHSPS